MRNNRSKLIELTNEYEVRIQFEKDGCIVYYQNTQDIEYFVQRIKMLDVDSEMYQQMYEQPLLKKEPSLNEALAFVYNAVKEMP
jgi:hypothetical protein